MAVSITFLPIQVNSRIRRTERFEGASLLDIPGGVE